MQVTIAGTGMNPNTISAEAERAIHEADVLIGAARLLSDYQSEGKETLCSIDAEEILEFLKARAASGLLRAVILVSGDPGFYSAAKKLTEALSEFSPAVLPGISSLSCFFARLGKSWQDAKLVSCHGRDTDPVAAVRRNKWTFLLTGGNVAGIAEKLTACGFGDLSCTAGEDLGLPSERIREFRVSGLAAAGDFSSLTVLLVENPAADPRVRFGLPDDSFLRGNVPMTKSEVRAVLMAKLSVRPGDTCWDVGCGTGSVTCEMALAAFEGRVYGIDKNEEALLLTRGNLLAQHIGNAEVVSGSAPEALSALPAPDAVFIGGSTGNLKEIAEAALKKNPAARLAVSAISLETAYLAVRIFEEKGLSAELIQLSVSRGKKAGGLHLLMANNPVFLITGGAS